MGAVGVGIFCVCECACVSKGIMIYLLFDCAVKANRREGEIRSLCLANDCGGEDVMLVADCGGDHHRRDWL